MANRCRVLVASSLLAFASATAVADQERGGSSLEEIMSPDQYRAAGLHKLTESERSSLYQWLREYTGNAPIPAAMPPGKNASGTVSAAPDQLESPGAVQSADDMEEFGFPEPPPDPLESREELHARVLQPFKGWDGKTVFKLDNGQVWQQRRSGRFTYLGDDTRVVIKKNSWGFYDMRLIDADRSVGVKRLK